MTVVFRGFRKSPGPPLTSRTPYPPPPPISVCPRYARQPGPYTESRLIEVGREGDIQIGDTGIQNLVKRLLASGYLARVTCWEGCFEPGRQISNEREYLKILAEEK